MNLSAILHRTSDNYCYPLNEAELIINLKTGYDVKKVFLIHGDPFLGGTWDGVWKWNTTCEEICFKKNLEHHIWWTTTLKPEYKRCKYYFRLVGEEETNYFFEDGFLTEDQISQEGRMLQCFTYPWMNRADVNRTPKWVNDTIWYQIFPDRFCNGEEGISPPWVKEWQNGKVTNEDFYGGDLPGITKKLDYLASLGISGLYLTPIFESPSSHKYDTTDYYKVDPYFGNEDNLRELVQKAHQRGMKVMLDGVFNHCGRYFKPWQDVLEKGPDSEYFDWFMINRWPFDQMCQDTHSGDFYSFAFNANMPKLNTNNEKVIAYFLQVCTHWVREFQIDGLRVDVANEISHKFCKELRKTMKQLSPDFYILGEIWHDAMVWLRGDEFDAVMNYPLTSGICDFWIEKERSKEYFEHMVNRCYTMYMQQTNDVLFNLLDSHDTDRLRNRVRNLDVYYQQLAVLFTMPGSPCIFYGTEVALEGERDPDCRRCMPWEDMEKGVYDTEIRNIKELIELRKNNPAMKSKYFHFPNEISLKRVVEYIKIDEAGNRIEILLNCMDCDVEIQDKGEVLFSRGWEEGMLKEDGVIIRKIS